MDYRDWGYGDRAPYERRPGSSWAGDGAGRSADDPSGTSWDLRPRPGLGAADLTDTDFDDAYWTPPSSAASSPAAPTSAAPTPSSAIPGQRGTGRHRDDSDEGYPVSDPISSSPVSSRPTSSPVSSGSFTSSSPVSSGSYGTRPISGGSVSAGPASSGPVSGGGWRPASPGRSWDRPAEPADWQRTPESDRWERSDDTGEWVRSAHTGTWRNPHAHSWSEPAVSDDWQRDAHPRDWRDDTSAGEWRRDAHTGQFDRVTDDAGWGVEGNTGEWDRSERTRRGRPAVAEPADSWQTSGDTFWSGTRLAGDDPRWVETPPSAPRSPAVAYPPQRSVRPAPPRTRTVRPTPATARPAYRPPVRRGRGNRLDEELLDFDPGGHVATLLYTALWYAVPVLFFALWLLTLDNTPPPPGCVTDVLGGGCQSERAEAIASLIGGAPPFGAAFAASLVVAVVLRWASGTWRAASVGLASAVVGGGLSTVLFSAVTG